MYSNYYFFQIHGNEMISIGLLLGMSAAKRGSMDLLATKKISTQLEALLPPTATDLPLSHTTQVAGKCLTTLWLVFSNCLFTIFLQQREMLNNTRFFLQV